MIIDVRWDVASIEIAAFELLEEGLARQYSQHFAQKLGAGENAEHAADDYSSERTLAPGFYSWTGHLFAMEQIRELGAMPSVSAREVDGLLAIARGRMRFSERHPACPHCTVPLFERLLSTCQLCGGKLERRAA